MPLNLSLKTKMSLIYTLLVVAILCIVATLTYHYSHAELKKSISSQQNTLASSLAHQIDERLSMAHEQLIRFADNIDAHRMNNPAYLEGKFYEEEDLLVFFDGGISLVSPSGTILAEYPSRPERIGASIPPGNEYFSETIKSRKPFVASPSIDPLLGEPVIAFTVPILNADSSLRAMLVGNHMLWSGRFFNALIETRVGNSGYFYIIDKHRDIVAHPDRKRVAEQIKPGSNMGVESALKGFEGTLENTNSQGVRGLSSFKRLTAAPWVLVVHYPLKEAYQPLEAALRYFLFIIAGAGIVSVLVIRFAMQRMMLPLLRLTEHVSNFGNKKGEERLVSIDSRDEIGRLAHTFNTMIGELDIQQRRLDEEMFFIESLVMNSAAPIFVIGRDHRVIYWNRALEKLTGFSASDMKGTDRQWEAFYGEKRPTMADVVLDHAENALPELYANFRPSRFIEGAYQAEGWYRLGSTGRHYLFFHASPIMNDEGIVIGAVETLEDVTEAKQIEEMLNDQYRFLQTIIDAIPTPVYYKDRLGRYIGCNSAFETFFGRSKKEIFGKTVRDLNPGEHTVEHEKRVEVCINSGQQQTYESSLVRSDGAVREIIVTKAPFYDKKDKVSGLVGTFTDITERRAMEEQLRNLSRAVEQSPVSIVITDTAGVIEYVNPKCCQVTGYDNDELVGQNPRILGSGELKPDIYSELWQTITSGREWQGEFHNRKKNGEEFWEVALISPLTDKNGTITHYLGIKEDITARKRTAQMLEANRVELELKHAELERLFNWVETAKQEWEQTLDSLRDMVIMTDPDGRIRRCNRLIFELAKKPDDEIIGAEWREILNEAGFIFSSFNGVTGELLHDRSKRLYSLNIYDISAAGSGTVTGRVVSINDTTEIRSMTDELQKAYDELQNTQLKGFQQEKLASIGQLAAGVAHEINNPMGFISSNLGTLGKYVQRMGEFINLLTEAVSGASSGELADSIGEQRKRLKIDYILDDTIQLIAESQDGAQRVRKIVQDLKSFSRVDDAERKSTDINDCLDTTINMVWNEIKYVATLKKEYGEISHVICYPQQLNQVFMNLLVNAAHAIKGQGEIRVRTWEDETNVYVAVSDTGHGIPSELQGRIFEPFFTTKEVGKGTGLGLSISYDIIKKHDGDISVESEVGSGTTFTVRLPHAEAGE